MTPDEIREFRRLTPTDVILSVSAGGAGEFSIIYHASATDDEWLAGETRDGRRFRARWERVDAVNTRSSGGRARLYTPRPMATWRR